MIKRVQTDFLFAQPSFVSGAGSVFDLWGQLVTYNESVDGDEADARAIASDWMIVGQDIFDAAQSGLTHSESEGVGA
jgi:hypothetical protein